jgi:hypothetical protein
LRTSALTEDIQHRSHWYIFKSTIVSLVKAVSIKMLYAPAAFVLLWVEQYSLVIVYFDNSI